MQVSVKILQDEFSAIMSCHLFCWQITVRDILSYRYILYENHIQIWLRDLLDFLMIRTIAAALVTSRLDYVNSVLYSIPAKYISRLQHTQNTLACIVAGNCTPGSNIATLSKLHWLPVHDHIKFKIVTMTHKAIYTG